MNNENNDNLELEADTTDIDAILDNRSINRLQLRELKHEAINTGELITA